MHFLYLLPILIQTLGAVAQPPAVPTQSGPGADRDLEVQALAADMNPLPQFSDSLVVPEPVGDAILACTGPKFGNALLVNELSGKGLGSCLGCIGVVAQEMPCILKFVKTGNPADITKCGVSLSSLCPCVDCLPAKLQSIIKPIVCAPNLSAVAMADGTTADLSNLPVSQDLVSKNPLSTNDINDKAVLGTISPMEIAFVKMNAAHQSMLSHGDVSAMSAAALSCGSCSGTCIGPCTFGVCLGLCLPF